MAMKRHITTIIIAALMLALSAQADNQPRLANRAIAVSGVSTARADGLFALSMRLDADSLFMRANRRIVLTPWLIGARDSVAFHPVVINGSRQQIMFRRRDYRQYEGAQVVEWKPGAAQAIDYKDQTGYAPWMSNANIVVREDLCGCGDIDEQNGVVVRKLRQPRVVFCRPKPADVKPYTISGRAFIDFPVNRTELHPNYRQNPRELAKIIDTINIVKRDANITITNIDIHGYASPESPYDHNAWLAEHRAATLKNYVRQMVKLDDRMFSVHFTPEDWDGLRRCISESNIDNRDELLALACDTTLAPDDREALIKSRYPEQYRFMLSTWYPGLRHSDYIISCTVRPFTVDEAKDIIKTRPQLLSLNEMYLVAQCYEAGSKEFNEVFETAVRLYPDSEEANLNAACSRLSAADTDAAKAYLDKAGDSPEANNAWGVYFTQKGDYDAAREHFAKAKDAGCKEAAESLENL